MEAKLLYHGKFNLHGQILEDWVRAYSKDQAFRLLCAHLSVQLQQTATSVRTYFERKPTAYEINVVKEDKK